MQKKQHKSANALVLSGRIWALITMGGGEEAPSKLRCVFTHPFKERVAILCSDTRSSMSINAKPF